MKNYEVREDFDSQLLYFTSSSCLADNSGLVFMGEMDGNSNIYWKDFSKGKITQLTYNTEGTLRSYVYFNGKVNKGFGKASVCLDNTRKLVYYIQGLDVYQVDLLGNLRQIVKLPDNQVTAFMDVSNDGKYLCIPTTDNRALETRHVDGPATILNMPGDTYIDNRIHEENLNSYLNVYAINSGKQILCEKVPLCWITHVQFHPKDSSQILYNHEWCSDCGVRRMWLWDGKHHKALRTIDEGRNINDWVCHEIWSYNGEYVIYHGRHYKNNLYFVGRINMESGEIQEIELPKEYTKYGHFSISSQGRLVSDGYYQTKDEMENTQYVGATWISVWDVDWDSGRFKCTPLVQHNTCWGDQDTHPHPIFSEDGKLIFYNTTHNGKREIRCCHVPPITKIRFVENNSI
ncbi:MAG: oligogalacturonate lyase family protein [Christensenellales bacterium]|jgi:oligogalacturonide lyase